MLSSCSWSILKPAKTHSQAHAHDDSRWHFPISNEFVLPQGQNGDGGSVKETLIGAKEGDEAKVELKTVSEISRCPVM